MALPPPETIPLEASDAGPEVYVFPASFAQERLWFLDQLDPESPLYNIAGAWSFEGDLDVEALAASLQDIVRRHEVLRTTFRVASGRPVQVVAPSLVIPVPVVDLTTLPEGERLDEARRRAVEEAQRPFSLAEGPLVRVAILRLAEQSHVVLMTFHHIVFDAWSAGVLFRELEDLYAGRRIGSPSRLSDLPIQYGDFAEWQREWLTGETLETQLSYWKKQLLGAPGLIELPADRPRPAVQSARGERYRIVLPPALSSELRALSRREGVTLFMTMLAAFQTFLARVTSQSDLVVGSPIAGRNRRETEDLIGCFVNTLVLRADVSGDPPFRELLRRTRDVALEAHTHQDLPFERLVEELKPERSLGHSPVFQVMFGLQNAPADVRELCGVTVRPFAVGRPLSHYDLSLDVTDREEGLGCLFSYNTELFDAATIERFARHFKTMLEHIVVFPDERVLRIPLLSASERRQILTDFNDTARPYPNDRCVHELVEEQVERAPAAVALVSGGGRTTYAEMNARANRLAHFLRRAGVGPDVLVGVCIERSPDLIVAVLAVLKAGGAYVPLDPAYPAERLAFMIEDSGAPVVLSTGKTARNLPTGVSRLVRLDEDAAAISAESEANPRPLANPENLAYIIYTSGSTGTPKGVQIRHRSVVNYTTFASERFELESTDRILQFSSISFDAAAEEIFPCLARGATLVLRTDLMLESPRVFLRTCGELGITVLDLPTAYWHELCAGLGAEPLPIPKSLRLTVIGGEKALADRAGQWLNAVGAEIPLLNGYGPTETTIAVTFSRLTAAALAEGRDVSIGKPVSNAQAYVLDRRLEPVPIGVAGELHIGGDGLARGYLNRPALTEEKFIPSPFASGARIYRTGDRVRYRSDGEIEYLDRVDAQVKVRGYRIELGEIEAALRRTTGVADALVVAHGEAQDKWLVAYVVPGGRPGPSAADLRQRLSRTLPDYMIPSVFVSLDAIPLTPTGKVDRRALPEPDSARLEGGRSFVAPRDEVETKLARMWEEILPVERVGIHDNFFDLGGHSLLAVRLFARLQKEFDREMPLATIFQAPTIEQLAGILRQEGWKPSWTSLVPIQPRGSRVPLYCIHAGGGNVLFYMDLARRLGPDQPVYGLQVQGLDGVSPRAERVEDMAAHYIKEIRELQSRGPYHIAGSSYGGIIAFEMAQQLQKQGHQMGILAVFDTWGPDYPKQRPTRTAATRWIEFAERVDLHLGNFLASKGARGKIGYVTTKSRVLAGNILITNRRRWAKIRKAMGLPRKLREVEEAIGKAKNRYVPQPYAGKLTLFRATRQPAGYGEDPDLGWTRVAQGGVEVHHVPGYHGAIVHEPRVPILAEQLTLCLDEFAAKKLTATASAGIPEENDGDGRLQTNTAL
ncbi:MAG: amino acid adenylation domain-containing protein [Thermoanaerobaculia bacterium]